MKNKIRFHLKDKVHSHFFRAAQTHLHCSVHESPFASAWGGIAWKFQVEAPWVQSLMGPLPSQGDGTESCDMGHKTAPMATTNKIIIATIITTITSGGTAANMDLTTFLESGCAFWIHNFTQSSQHLYYTHLVPCLKVKWRLREDR